MLQKKTEPDWERNAKRIIVAEVAQKSGVSAATVYRVLKGESYVAAKTRNAVQQALQDLGYEELHEPQETKDIIGVTAATMIDGHYTKLLAGVTEGLHARNVQPIICPIPRRHNCGATFLERIRHTATAGALILGLTETEEELIYIQQTQTHPFVIIDPGRPVDPRLPVVTAAYKASAQTVIEHLLELGHRRIGIITHTTGLSNSQDLFAGYQIALASVGLLIDTQLIIDSSDGSIESGQQAAQQLLQHSQPPTAIFAVSDKLALGAMDAAQEQGIDIPSQLSIVGFGNSETAQATRPKLTTVHIPLMEIGAAAADLLYRHIQRKRDGLPMETTRLEVATQLVVQASTAPLYNERSQ